MVTAKWTAKESEEETVLDAIKKLTPLIRNEPGNRYFQATRDLANPRVFFLFEIYDDEEAYKAHGSSEHFQKYGFGQAIPALESREREFYRTIDS